MVSDADWFKDHVPSSCFVFLNGLALPLGGSWWHLVALFWLWLGVSGALGLVSWWLHRAWCSGSLCGMAIAEPQGSAALVGFALRIPSLEVTSFSHTFCLWPLSVFLFLTCQNWGLQLCAQSYSINCKDIICLFVLIDQLKSKVMQAGVRVFFLWKKRSVLDLLCSALFLCSLWCCSRSIWHSSPRHHCLRASELII